MEILKRRAKEDGRSLQSEVKFILEQAAHEPKVDTMTRKSALLAHVGEFKMDSAHQMEEFHRMLERIRPIQEKR